MRVNRRIVLYIYIYVCVCVCLCVMQLLSFLIPQLFVLLNTSEVYLLFWWFLMYWIDHNLLSYCYSNLMNTRKWLSVNLCWSISVSPYFIYWYHYQCLPTFIWGGGCLRPDEISSVVRHWCSEMTPYTLQGNKS